MLRTREDVAIKITNIIKRHISDRKKLQEWMIQLQDDCGMPIPKSNDIFMLKTDVIDESDFVMYLLLSVIEPQTLDMYFTAGEIEKYSKHEYNSEKAKFPIKYKAVEIVEGQQYMVATTARELMKLKDSQLIRYNANTQRAMNLRIAGGVEYYTINIMRKSVDAIQDCLRNRTYIPTYITLNMLEDTDFSFDKDSGELLIKSASFFDIIDGYHRYLAISNCCNEDSKFDYPVGIQFVSFDESRAKQYIYQEDQKTKLRKIDSDSLNQTSPANKIVNQLNTNANFLLAGKIGRNESQINLSELSDVVDAFWYGKTDVKKSEELKYMLEVKNKLIEGFNGLVEYDVELADKKWDYDELIAAVYVIYNNMAFAKFEDVVGIIRNNDIYRKNRGISKLTINKITRLLGGE